MVWRLYTLQNAPGPTTSNFRCCALAHTHDTLSRVGFLLLTSDMLKSDTPQIPCISVPRTSTPCAERKAQVRNKVRPKRRTYLTGLV